jgi:hypothetical protein
VHSRVSNGSPSFTLDIWNILEIHKATLRTLVHQQRDFHEDEDEDFGQLEELDIDNSDLSLSIYEKEMEEWSKERTRHPLSGLDLDFLGLCCHPELLLVLFPTILYSLYADIVIESCSRPPYNNSLSAYPTRLTVRL